MVLPAFKKMQLKVWSQIGEGPILFHPQITLSLLKTPRYMTLADLAKVAVPSNIDQILTQQKIHSITKAINYCSLYTWNVCKDLICIDNGEVNEFSNNSLNIYVIRKKDTNVDCVQ